MLNISNYIKFYRKCYRSDNRDLSIWNVFKLTDSYWLDSDTEELAAGDFMRIPLPDKEAELLFKKQQLKIRETNLVYGVVFITGKLSGLSGFVSERNICSPLIYFDAEIKKHDDNYYFSIDRENSHINTPLMSEIISNEEGAAASGDFPTVNEGIDNLLLGSIVSWLNHNTIVENTLELVRYPKLLNKRSIKGLMDSDSSICAVSAAALMLVDRPKGSRGILHELKLLESAAHFSPPLKALFEGKRVESLKNSVDVNKIPGLLSASQVKALEISANEVLGLVSGPPGTGKSYTIAAIALDRLLHGESVLIVSETDQALDVVSNRLAENFNVSNAVLRTGKKEFLKELKKSIDNWLKFGVEPVHDSDIQELQSSLQVTKNKIDRNEREFIARANKSTGWGQVLAKSGNKPRPSIIDRIKCAYIKWRVENSDFHWEKIIELQRLLEKRDADASRYLKKHLGKCVQDLLERNRLDLSKFNMAIRARSSHKQLSLHSEINHNLLFRAFPVWLSTLDMVHHSLPLKNQLFDLLIIDEATQCNIAAVLPALQRAKRVLIVGDSKQLKHVSFISYKKERKILNDCALDDSYYDAFSYKKNSILDLVSNSIVSQKSVVMLDEHYRSKPDLISFSNSKFYNSRLKIMQHRPNEYMSGNIYVKQCTGVRNTKGVNNDEALAVVEQVKKLITEHFEFDRKPSIGILSPYRDQVVYLQKLLLSSVSSSDIELFSIRVATPYGFQGDEKDFMILSMSVDNDSRRAAAYLNKEDMFNVAITRSRQRIYIFTSIDHEILPINNLFREYMESIESAVNVMQVNEIQFDRFQQQVCEVLNGLGITTFRSYPVAGRNVDILCSLGDRNLAIDLIGFPGEFNGFLELDTYYLFSRAGLEIFPLSYGLWSINNELCLKEILGRL